MRNLHGRGIITLPEEDSLPPSLKSQYDIIRDAISQADVVSKEIASIVAFYAMSVGYKTDFRRSYITYTGNGGCPPTVASYKACAPDYQYALLDFSFRGRCMIRFKIHQKGDEMWLGVVGDQYALDERKWIKRGAREGTIWSYYCGRTRSRYYEGSKAMSFAEMMANFKPELNCNGIGDGGYGSLHFPRKTLGRLLPCNTGDVVDLVVDAQEKTFTVIVNDVFQACAKAPRMPDQLSFWIELDDTGDRVEFELLDFSFEKRRKQVGIKNALDEKELE